MLAWCQSTRQYTFKSGLVLKDLTKLDHDVIKAQISDVGYKVTCFKIKAILIAAAADNIAISR